jgi:hypothetical protein
LSSAPATGPQNFWAAFCGWQRPGRAFPTKNKEVVKRMGPYVHEKLVWRSGVWRLMYSIGSIGWDPYRDQIVRLSTEQRRIGKRSVFGRFLLEIYNSVMLV